MYIIFSISESTSSGSLPLIYISGSQMPITRMIPSFSLFRRASSSMSYNCFFASCFIFSTDSLPLKAILQFSMLDFSSRLNEFSYSYVLANFSA